jgi:acetylornithine deacetylase
VKNIAERIRTEAEKNRDYLVRLIQDTVRISSYSGEEEEIQRFLQRKLAGLGMQTRLIKVKPEKLEKYKGFSYDGFSYERRCSLVGEKKGQGGSGGNGRSLMLNGHVDVVPPGDLSAWSDDPLSGRYLQGRVYGRGSLDMKGGLCAAITAVKILQDLRLCQLRRHHSQQCLR